MKIVIDTNKLYDLGSNELLLHKVSQEPITPTFVSLRELTTTGNLLAKPTEVRDACRAMLRYEDKLITEPPFLYLAKLYESKSLDGINPPPHDLVIARMLAAGETIAPGQEDKFYEFVKERRAELQKGADIFNHNAIGIRERIGENKRQHLAIDSLQLTAEFIQFCVSEATNKHSDLAGYTSEKFELLLVVLDQFFKKIETSPMSYKPNDLYDFALLAYVQPGDKLWTSDGRWVGLIKEVGLERYLYSPPL
jgi:hypothetical protein